MSSRPGRDRDERPSTRGTRRPLGATLDLMRHPGPRPGPRRAGQGQASGCRTRTATYRRARSRSSLAVLIVGWRSQASAGVPRSPHRCPTRARPRPEDATSPPSSSTANGALLARAVRRAEPKRPAARRRCPPHCGRRSSRPRTSASTSTRASTRSVSRARSWTDVVLGKKSQGGSTITQQYVKNAFVHAREDAQAQGRRGAARQQAREELHQGPDPRALPQHHLLRARRLRRRGRLAGLLRQGRREARPRRVRDARRRHQVARSLLALPGPGATRSTAATPCSGRCWTQCYITAEQETAAVAHPVKTAGLKSSADGGAVLRRVGQGPARQAVRRRTACTAAA